MTYNLTKQKHYIQ